MFLKLKQYPGKIITTEEALRRIPANTNCYRDAQYQQARRIADKTVFMYLGEIIEEGKTDDIFNHPVKELTTNYVKGRFG